MKAIIKYTTLTLSLLINSLLLNAQDVIKKPLAELKGHKGIVEGIAYSPNGKYFATTGWDKTIKIWSADSNKLVHSFKAHDGAVRCLAYSRDGKMLISGARDNSVKIWDSTYTPKYNLFGHQNIINAVLIDPSLRFAYSGGDDMMLKVWDLKKKGKSRTLKKMPRKINAIAVSIRGRDIYVATEGPDIYNLTVVGKEKNVFSGHTDEVNALAYAFNNKYLISGSSDKTAIIWNVKNGKIVQTLKGHTWKVTQVAFSNDSRFAITGSTDGSVKIWDVKTGKLLHSYENGVNAITALAFSPNITRIASAAMVNSYVDEEKKNLVYVWDSKQELVAVTKARLQRERIDSIAKAKKELRRVRDSTIRAKDSLKRADKQRRIEEKKKAIEEKKKREAEKKKGTPKKEAPKGDTGNAILVEEDSI
jgi:WD40 repeat protein